MDSGKACRAAEAAGPATKARMIDPGWPIRLVFDTSAILAYTRGSVHVGEPLAELADEGCIAGLPVLCLVEASWLVDDLDRLGVLLQHPATTVLPTPGDFAQLAAIQHVVGALDATSAMRLAIEADCYVLSARAGLYGGLPDGGPVIEC
jgi:hypothetical protein